MRVFMAVWFGSFLVVCLAEVHRCRSGTIIHFVVDLLYSIKLLFIRNIGKKIFWLWITKNHIWKQFNS